MSKNKPPLPPLPQPQMQVDLSKGHDVTCENCGNYTFEEVYMMKFFSEVASPTGKAGNLPIPTFACCSCGYVNDAFLPPYLRNKAPDAPAANTEAAATQPTSLTIVKS